MPIREVGVKRFLAIIVFAGTSLGFGAERLTWEQCVREAASKNYDVLAAEQAVEKARGESRSAFSPFLPQLTADASYGDGTIGESYDYGLTVRQSLFAGFRDKAHWDRARLSLQIAEARLQIAKAKLSFD